MDFLNLVIDKALILVPTLYIIGAFLKKTPVIPDWCIPWILLAAGVGCAFGLLGVSADAMIQGILVAGASVLGNQLIKQTTNRD